VLGICYGMQLLCHLLGGEVEPAAEREYRGATIEVKAAEGLFRSFDRYALAVEDDDHRHPHFSCESCGRILCLPPARLTASMTLSGAWKRSVADAVVHLRGVCPDCRAAS
jgi:hypothetical protein